MHSCLPRYSQDGRVYDSSHHKMALCMHVCVEDGEIGSPGFMYVYVCACICTCCGALTLCQPTTSFATVVPISPHVVFTYKNVSRILPYLCVVTNDKRPIQTVVVQPTLPWQPQADAHSSVTRIFTHYGNCNVHGKGCGQCILIMFYCTCFEE